MTAHKPRDPALGFIFVTLILLVLGFGIIIPVLPGLVTQFQGGSFAEGSDMYGILIMVYALMQFVMAPILGSLSDKFGRRRVLLVALAGAAIDYLITAWAPTMTWLFIARIISGATAGALATCNAYIADVTPPEKRAQGFGLVGAAFGIGFTIGPALGGFLGKFGLRVPFYFAAAIVAANWLYGALVLPESLPAAHRKAFSWKRANPVGAILMLRKFRGVLDLAGMYFIFSLGNVMLQSIWVLYTGYRYHWGPAEVGLSLMAVGILTAIFQTAAVKPIVARIGERASLVSGLLISTVAIVGYGCATQGWMIYAILPFGALGGIAGPAAQALITKHVPPDQQGAVQGSLSGLNSLATIIAPPLATWSFGIFITPGHYPQLPGIAFFEAGVLLLFSVVLALASFRADARREAATA